MTDTPRPTPADLQTWRREALTEHRFNDVDSELDVMARRILALLDALTAAEQEADSDRERAVAHEMDANGLRDTVRHLKAALTAKDEALAAMQEKVHELTRPMADVEYHNRAPGGWMDEVKLLEAESARLTAQVEALKGELREISLALNDPAEHNTETTAQCIQRLTAQVVELQQQLAEADAGDDVRAFERTVKEQSERIVALMTRVERLVLEVCAAERRANAAEAQVTRLTETVRQADTALSAAWWQLQQVSKAIADSRAALTPATPPEGPTPTGGK